MEKEHLLHVTKYQLDAFREEMDATLGQGACHVLSIRPYGGVELEVIK